MLIPFSAMAQWMVVLWFCLCGVLHGQETPTVQECCQDGRAAAMRGQDCTVLTHISSIICRFTWQQCCRSAARDILCDNGIKMAREQGVCGWPFVQEDPRENQILKMCCDCCTFGVMAGKQGLSCQLHGLLLGKQCTYVAQTCCGKNTTEESKPNVRETEKPGVVTTQPPEKTTTCRDSKCSQLCVGNGTCGCYDGYQLRKDEVSCEDVNECLSGNHNCVYGQACINTEGSFRCQRETSCGTGYELTDNNHCQDIDECALGTHNCGPDFVCSNTAGSFRCHPKERCADGYIQDAIGSCIDVNECLALASPCPYGQTCINTMGSYACRSNTLTCARGYHLTEDGTRCEDVDECRTGNVCGVHGCINLVGSYRCECLIGFIFNSITKHCEDVNECRYYPGQLCAHKCDNTEGSYKCSCTTGFKLAHDGRSCEDVNECEANPCSQECANVYGSYQCYCRRGYQLSDIDGITCEDIDECALPTGGHVCSYQCFNTPGSFGCSCPPTGYTLGHDGRTCQDVDECATGSHTCSVTESCFNVQGGFRCLSFECPPNFRQAAVGGDASASLRCMKDCHPHDAACVVNPVNLITHAVLSLPTFRDFSQPEEIVLLRTVAAAKAQSHPPTDVFFDILTSDDQASFDVVKRSHYGRIMGVMRQVKPITGPKDLVLEVAMSYVKSGTVTQRNVVIIHVFISEFWF